MTNTNNILENLRSLAVANGEIAHAHLVTAAINGEQWAIDRLASLVDAARDAAFGISDGTLLAELIALDTTRPDGGTARGFSFEP